MGIPAHSDFVMMYLPFPSLAFSDAGNKIRFMGLGEITVFLNFVLFNGMSFRPNFYGVTYSLLVRCGGQ